MKKILKKSLLVLAILLIVIIVILVAYVVYLQTGYFRYEDDFSLEINNQQNELMDERRFFSVLTYNVGFGAYDQDYSFFMDSGVMKTGEKVSGKYGKGISEENVEFNIKNSAVEASGLNADFYLFQEVDIKASRSYNINQRDIIEEYLPNLNSVYASNFHSRFLFYPFTDPHGSVEAGLLTLSKYEMKEATRKSYTVDEGFFIKFFDLDRCFSVHRYDVKKEDGSTAEFVLINHHMSAYDEGGMIRKKQMAELFEFADSEYQKGNYVVIGGDFNHALSDSEHLYATEQEFPNWVSIFPEDELPSGFNVVSPDNMANVATCRTADIPYEKGVNYEAVIDGFIVSSNIEATATIIDLDYFYSDHNPVQLDFTLK